MNRKVKQMTPASQNFRHRVLAMLAAREAALNALCNGTEETRAARRTTESIRRKIELMR